MAEAIIRKHLLSIVGYLVVVCSIAYFAINRYLVYRRLKQFKGPWIAAVSKLWMVKSTYRGTMHLDVADACRRYGHIARISPNDLVTDDYEILRRMSAVRSPYTRSDWYDGTSFDHKLDHVFSERNEARHLDLRSRMTSGYSGKENSHLEECVDNRLLDLFKLIHDNYMSSKSALRPVDFARITQYLSLDVISDVSFGEPFGFLTKDEDVHEYIKMQRALLPVFEWFSTLPSLNRLIRIGWISRLVMPSPEDKTGVGKLMGIAKQIVARRFGPERIERKDMLGSFISHGLSQREAEIEAVLQIMAGSDTTVTALRTITLFIITQPRVYTALQSELDAATCTNRLSNPIARHSETLELPYLQACIKEGLRIWPPVMGLMQKTVPPGGDTLNGQFVPAGTNIGYCAWGVHRNKEVFGGDADIYRPERWLGVEEERLARMHKVGDLVFGSGRYGCLGKPIALLEISKALAEVCYAQDI
ncbi:hypothetical protein FGG08_005503 [Glutinoglossum americanum]|uniref:Pisatin demethylase n=1 Tax=Glutinoglossum americanum TaxID=1670608 RepID=A0A9P8I071_9PEZI|nr:hypothetical protein FGG08_005503 [Glutinoglossum americanum]